MTGRMFRCAIYTRKSSEEGLEQGFNSLDAQREAGEAYIKSQAHEGWRLLNARYDDGGFSGGSMKRPGLTRLLEDVEAGLIDVVVVYKIDRLTRSLADFARIVETFDTHEVSFVSVTQSFNTTSSMGRLTLNVLLSFAQFEREVTGERIRDKIAASKAKGMWMGGVPPLGYDLPLADTRTLRVNETEAATVRHIFTRYCKLGSVHALQRELTADEIHSKQHRTQRGRLIGGNPFSRGALFHMLRNRIYLGQIVHRGTVHDGEHAAIVATDLFDAVQRALSANGRKRNSGSERPFAKAPLTGKLFDANGESMSPTFSRGQSGRSYRYYVSSSLQKGAKAKSDGIVRRLPARDIESIVASCAERWFPASETPLAPISEVRLNAQGLHITLAADHSSVLPAMLAEGETMLYSGPKRTVIQLDMAFPLRRKGAKIVAGDRSRVRIDPALIKALRNAHAMLRRDRQGMPVMNEGPRSPYLRRILRLAFLAPDIQRDILAGRQPPGLTLEALRKISIPLSWNEQRFALGWTSSSALPVPA